MKHLFVCLLCLCTGVFVMPVRAQNKSEKIPYRFGKVSPEDLKVKRYDIDTAADAVILADVGETSYNALSGDLGIDFHYYTRIHILHKAGYDAGNFSVYLSIGTNNSTDDRLSDLKAVTYNLENGQVVETKLESKTVYTNKLSSDLIEKRISLPNIKEGSIIELSYTTHSYADTHLPAWTFQGEYPRLWSEYNVSIPEWFRFVFLNQGYYKVDYTKTTHRENFVFRYSSQGGTGATETAREEAEVADHKFVAHNMPALHEEHYTTTIKNHVQKIEFQFSAMVIDGVTKQHMQSWSQVAKQLMESEYFGASLDRNNGFLADAVKEAIGNAATPREKAERIYSWVQKNIACTDEAAMYMQDINSLKTVLNTRKGNSAEVNLLLIAMLRRIDITASPLILSTRSHGITFELYPILRRFNYTIAYAEIEGQEFTLDASRPLLGFGKLPLDCYNGYARIIGKEAYATFFSADSLKEQSLINVMMNLDSTGNWEGNYQQTPGYHISYEVRKQVKDKGAANYFKAVGKAFANDLEVKNEHFEDLDSLATPVTEVFDFKIANTSENADRIYFTPMFGDATKANPFTVAERRYPVEMPFVQSEMFNLNIEVPDNYEVEEMPKPAVVKLNDGDCVFQYLVQSSGSTIQLRSVIKFSRANFLPEEYNDLRTFFDYIVKKQAEQIVLKKKA